jgi:DNA-binding NarL/FixJ family response regulator
MNVWLVEDDDRLRENVACELTRRGDVDVTGTFANGSAVMAAIARGATADVALIDLELPDVRGEAVIRAVRDHGGALAVALAERADDDALFGALAAGAVGYLLKEASLDEIAGALKAAVAGGAPFTPSIARRVVHSFHAPRLAGAQIRLTPREHQVLELLCSGATYREVACLLAIAEGTVQTYVKAVYEKLGVCSKAEAVRVAYESALVAPRRA